MKARVTEAVVGVRRGSWISLGGWGGKEGGRIGEMGVDENECTIEGYHLSTMTDILIAEHKLRRDERVGDAAQRLAQDLFIPSQGGLSQASCRGALGSAREGDNTLLGEVVFSSWLGVLKGVAAFCCTFGKGRGEIRLFLVGNF
jgi:hypothetical protein